MNTFICQHGRKIDRKTDYIQQHNTVRERKTIKNGDIVLEGLSNMFSSLNCTQKQSLKYTITVKIV